jgi:chromate transport protein ChrA
MNPFFELFGGPIAVLLSIISTIVVSRRWKAGRSKITRGILVAFLYWGPLFLLSCMLLHIIQNTDRAYVSISENGVFNFYFYSLQLFGFVVGYQSFLLLKSCRKHVACEKRFNQKALLNIGLIILTTLPTFVFTPIGIIPAAVLFITFIISLTTHRSATAVNHFTT